MFSEGCCEPPRATSYTVEKLNLLRLLEIPSDKIKNQNLFDEEIYV
jgi:hypothetical protein